MLVTFIRLNLDAALVSLKHNMKHTRHSCLVILGLFLSFQSFALTPIQVQVDQAVSHGQFQLGVGSHLKMQVPESGQVTEGIFLGRIVESTGTYGKFILLDLSNTRVYLADGQDVEMATSLSAQPLIHQYDQIGGTCTGYAMDHILQQLYWSGYQGNGSLRTTLSTEQGRTQLLVDTINEYYLALQHKYSVFGVMKKFGTRFGFKCEKKTFDEADSASDYLEGKMERGLPVMISFSTGVTMVNSSYEVVDYENPSPAKDMRLWVPRKIGERNGGGHTVVAAGMFEAKGRKKLLMMDSDWAEPRVWDIQSYLGERAAISEMEFITCE